MFVVNFISLIYITIGRVKFWLKVRKAQKARAKVHIAKIVNNKPVHKRIESITSETEHALVVSTMDEAKNTSEIAKDLEMNENSLMKPY